MPGSSPGRSIDPREGSWDERRCAIARFLDITAGTDAPWPEAQLERFVGEYRHGSRRLFVGLGDGGLTLDGLLWPRNRLLPMEPNVLEAESWPFRLTFLDGDGVIRGVRIDGPAVGQRRIAGTYEKARPV